MASCQFFLAPEEQLRHIKRMDVMFNGGVGPGEKACGELSRAFEALAAHHFYQ